DPCETFRNRSDCVESNSEFACQENGAEVVFSKEMCINNSGANDYNEFNIEKSSQDGKIFTTSQPLLIALNQPRNKCNNRACSYVHYNELVELRNSCGNCLDAQ